MLSPDASLGYDFYPPHRPDAPGHSCLTVWLRAHPTERHYDPESVHCQIVDEHGERVMLAVKHPWPYAGAYRLSLGRVILNDRKDKKVEGFVFGGDLHIENAGATTTCVIHSPAPILALLDPESPASQFVAEIEARLAERQAAWDMAGQRDFDRRLAALEPLALFQASLLTLTAHLHTIHASHSPAERQIEHLIQLARQSLQAAGHWAPETRTLADIL